MGEEGNQCREFFVSLLPVSKPTAVRYTRAFVHSFVRLSAIFLPRILSQVVRLGSTSERRLDTYHTRKGALKKTERGLEQ